MNPTTVDSQLEHNQLLNRSEQLCNLEWRPSHQSSYQQHEKSMDAVIVLVVWQTQPVAQGVWPSVHVMGIVEWPPI